jgi:NAD-dependent deacetylase
MIRPDVVLYGESLDENVVNDAIQSISDADMLIVGGTSLAVYPAAGMLRYFNADRVVVINKSELAISHKNALVFNESIGDVLSLVEFS